MEDEKYLKELGKKIALLRKKEGLTQLKFAEKHQIDRASLARIESGGVNSTINKLREIAKALSVDIGELVNL